MARDHWKNHAAQWALLSSPLRPCAEDVALFSRALGSRPGKGLLLGVTPELSGLSDDMVAIDHNPGMIAGVWPGGPVVQGSWLDMPFADGSFDFVIGDGHMTQLAFPQGYEKNFAQLARILKPGGRAVLRVFTAPEKRETIADVLGNPGKSFHAFKWRFAQTMSDPNIPVADIHAAFLSAVPDRDSLPFPRTDIDTIDVYKDAAAVYSFPTRADLRQVTRGWGEESCATGSYELAERCPILCLTSPS